MIGFVVGAAAVIGTQVVVAQTGTNEFCGTACHSHAQFVYPEYKQSAHSSYRTGVKASCSACHVPHDYPAKLFYKARAGIRDALAEMRGTIATREAFERERGRLANEVWDEMRANNSANCRRCHDPASMAASRQSEFAQKMHRQALDGTATCIDCHKGVAHVEAEEPVEPAKNRAVK